MPKPVTVRFHRTCSLGLDRLKKLAPRLLDSKLLSASGSSIFIDDQRAFQTIEGFGGAFTESAASVLNTLPAAQQRRFFQAYFDPVRGHGYTFCRTHMNSCDFSLGNYACADVPGDRTLSHFSIAREKLLLLSLIHISEPTRPY